jgi:hypothetical protein
MFMKSLAAVVGSLIILAAITTFEASARPSLEVAVQVQIEDSQADDSLVTQWIGVAVSANGKTFQVDDQNSEMAARNAAKFKCEQTTGRTCAAISVPIEWGVVGMTCARPGQSRVPLVAGSQSSAIGVAINKLRAAGIPPSNCIRVLDSQ